MTSVLRDKIDEQPRHMISQLLFYDLKQTSDTTGVSECHNFMQARLQLTN